MMKKNTEKKPRTIRVTLDSVLSHEAVQVVKVFKRDDGQLLYLIELKEHFEIRDFFKVPSDSFAVVGGLHDVPMLLQYVVGVPF